MKDSELRALLREAAGPRPIPPGLRARLEDTVRATALAVATPRSTIALRIRTKQRASAKPARRRWRTLFRSAQTIAATAAIIAFASLGITFVGQLPTTQLATNHERDTGRQPTHAQGSAQTDSQTSSTPARVVTPSTVEPRGSALPSGLASTSAGRKGALSGPTGTCGFKALPDAREVGWAAITNAEAPASSVAPTGSPSPTSLASEIAPAPASVSIRAEVTAADPQTSYGVWLVEVPSTKPEDASTCGGEQWVTGFMTDETGAGGISNAPVPVPAGEHAYLVVVSPGTYKSPIAFVTAAIPVSVD